MSDLLDAPLHLEAPDGRNEVLLQEGARLPAETRAMFATQQAGERSLVFGLRIGSGPTTQVRCDLPPGLPPNTWLAAFVSLSQDLRLHVEIRENLRRLRLEANLSSAENTPEANGS